jgi:hypothetical protein
MVIDTDCMGRCTFNGDHQPMKSVPITIKATYTPEIMLSICLVSTTKIKLDRQDRSEIL